MKQFLFSLMCGMVFGVGLLVSQMGDPDKVLQFLDVFGTWDPSLAFLIGGPGVTQLGISLFSVGSAGWK